MESFDIAVKRILTSVAMCALLSAVGCTRTVRLYPIEALDSSSSVIVGKIHGSDISFTLPSGEVCKGKWHMAPLPVRTGKAGPSQLAPVWDQVYGPGYYTAHVLGTRLYGQAAANGTQGTTLTLEFHQSDDVHNGDRTPALFVNGVAKDNRNNVYKLTLD